MSIEIGARYAGNGRCEFIVWAPQANEVTVKLVSPEGRMIPMERDEWGYWRARAEKITPGAQYLYHINDDEERPDPASHFQPLGVHGPSACAGHQHGLQQWGISNERTTTILCGLHSLLLTSRQAIAPSVPL